MPSSILISAGHAWQESGTYNVTDTATDGDGGNSQTTETATVTDAQLSWVGGSNAPSMPPGWNQTFEAAPTITAPADQTNTEGDSINLQVQASDTDGDTLSYDVLDLPPGLSINSSTGVISGTVAYGAAEDFGGSYNPTIIVADGHGGSTQASFAWTINQAQIAPTLTAPSTQTDLRGDNVSVSVNASQVDSDPMSYDATNLPPGLSIDPDTGVISGTVDPSANLSTPYAVTVTSTDEATNLSTSQTFNWTVSPTNVVPVLTNPSNQTNSAGDQVSLQLSASDADGDPLTYTATGLPAGLTLDPINGLISGTLPNSAASSTSYNVTLTASDGMASSTQSFTWAVNAVSLQNPGDQGNLDGDSASLQLTASDANNATLTYSATGLPSGLSINSSTGLISGTISSTADTTSPYAVTVTATDSANNSVSQAFNWTVARVSLNPVSDQENQEGTIVSLQLSAADNEGTPTYSATGLPSGLTISSTGLVSGTAVIGSFGSSPNQVTVTATDGSATSSESFVWTVTRRVALVTPGPQSSATGDSISLQLSATSPGGTMSYSATGLPAGLSISSSGLISGSPTTASTTPYTATVTANDGTSSSSQTFNWTVSPINLVAPADQTNNDGDTVSLPLTTGYHGSGMLSYSAAGLPSALSINSQTGQITGAISGTADTNSPYSVTVTATDHINTSSQTFNWTVNSAVSIDSIDDQSNAAGDSVSLQASGSDVNNSTLTYSATGLPTGLSINSTTGLIGGTIAVGDDLSSPYAVTVTATDSAGNSASQSFNWNVAHLSLANPGQLTSIDGANVSLQLQGSDADGDTVTYTATGLPSGLSINTSTGLISGTVASNADTNSPYAVTVTASDGVKTTTQSFLWTVSQVALNAPSDQTNSEGDTVSLQLQGAASNGSLSYNSSGLPAGLSLNPTTGLISGSVAAGDGADGPYTIDVSASNGTVSASQSFTWSVNPVVTLTAPADQSNVEDSNVSLQVAATDSKNVALSYAATGLPAGLSINGSTGLISGTISTGDSANGPYAVTVTASDGNYSGSILFYWTVTHPDTTALAMTNPGTQVNVTGDSVNLPISARDPDGIDSLIYSATGLPDGLNIDPVMGIISGDVADDAVSTMSYSVTVTADDGNGETVSQTFNWLINPSIITDPPSPISAVEGNDTGSITLATFTTPDLNSQAGDFMATITWGDGNTDTGTVSGQDGSFTVTDDHTYAEAGSYAVSITITDTVTGASSTDTTTATVADAALNLTGGLQLGDPNSDAPSSFTLASFTDGNPDASASDFSVQIAWGDGVTSQGNNYVQSAGNGVFLIVASHNYPTLSPPSVGPNSYNVTVTVTDADGGSAQTTDTIVVGKIAAGSPATMGAWMFQDQNSDASAGDFVVNGQTDEASVNWGDGNSDVAPVSGGPGTGSGYATQFSVTAAHTFTQDSYDQLNGQNQVAMTLTDDDGVTLTGTQYVSVTRPPMAGNGDEVEGDPGVALNNAQVAEFTVPDATDGISEFSATIDWGDGGSSGGTIQEVSPGLFEVLGSHTYAAQGLYPITVEVEQAWSTDNIALIVSSLGVFGHIPPVVLKSVDFKDGTPVKLDTESNFDQAPNPQWLMRDSYTNNVLTSQTPKDAAPYAYVRGDTLKVDAGFDPMYRGYTPNNIIFQAGVWSDGKLLFTTQTSAPTKVNFSGSYLVKGLSANGKFSDKLADYKNLDIVWQASANGGKTWFNVGKSSNEVYLTYAKPAPGAVEYYYQTVVAYGSASAAGKDKPSDVLAGIWSNFSSQTAKRSDGKLLSYYKPWLNNKQSIGYKLKDLLTTGNAQCSAFAQLLYWAIAAQGLPNQQEIGKVDTIMVTPKPGIAPQGTTEGFLIGPKAWIYGRANSGVAIYPWVNFVTAFPGYNAKGYLFPGNSAVRYSTGKAIPGQNNENPLSLFYNHVVVEINGVYYDPSYGVIYKTKGDMQTTAIAGFFNITRLEGKRQLLIRTPGKDELDTTAIKPDSLGPSS